MYGTLPPVNRYEAVISPPFQNSSPAMLVYKNDTHGCKTETKSETRSGISRGLPINPTHLPSYRHPPRPLASCQSALPALVTSVSPQSWLQSAWLFPWWTQIWSIPWEAVSLLWPWTAQPASPQNRVHRHRRTGRLRAPAPVFGCKHSGISLPCQGRSLPSAVLGHRRRPWRPMHRRRRLPPPPLSVA